ncbi:hypothetical protein [Oceanobacillus profundus]|uniref:hypothetical protein n=1 Tax=Oceanobacillus TaxID=182709 RepID=UPI0026E1B281|nr:hypothetical protein [Oceanobacillus profundus]MDO6451211.1 hypothetical protein [Oceanobacillus profundus]
MSAEEKIIEEIEKLPNETKKHVLKKLHEKYFTKHEVFVADENYDFWLNEKDEEYESDI